MVTDTFNNRELVAWGAQRLLRSIYPDEGPCVASVEVEVAKPKNSIPDDRMIGSSSSLEVVDEPPSRFQGETSASVAVKSHKGREHPSRSCCKWKAEEKTKVHRCVLRLRIRHSTRGVEEIETTTKGQRRS
jgi:hypothetical protein